MLHFVRVYTVCKGKKDLKKKENNIFLKIITWHPQICTMNYPKFIVSNQKEESISIQRVKGDQNQYKIIFPLFNAAESYLSLCLLGDFSCFSCRLLTFSSSKLTFWKKKKFRNTPISTWQKLQLTSRARTGFKSTWIYRTVLKVLENYICLEKYLKDTQKTLKSPWILPFARGFNTVLRDLNQYKIVGPLFGAAYAAPNEGTTILY